MTAWIRSNRLGNPEELETLVDVLRQAKDYLDALDPALRLISTAAEIEARVAQILSLASTPRTLGLLLAELLLSFVEPYLTDGVYLITHTNLRHVVDKIGVMPMLPWAQDYLAQADLEHLAGPTEETSSYLNFGPELSLEQIEEDPAFVTYRNYPQVISGQLDLHERAAVQQLVSLLGNTQEFSNFEQWRDELCAAFYDQADPLRPVAAPRDKLGGLILVAAGQDPSAVVEAFNRLKSLLNQTVQSWTDFSDVSSALSESLPGEFSDLPQQLKDSLQWTGLQAYLQPHLTRRFGTTPDFQRLSTADALPFLRALLLDAANLASFSGVPFPASLGLLDAAQLMAKRIELFQQSLDATLALFSAVMDILDTAGIYRLALTPQTGGVDGLVRRIRAAELDDDVRLTSSSVRISISPTALPVVVETKLGQITALPEEPELWGGYAGEQPGDFVSEQRLLQMQEGFLAASAEGFAYTPAQVWRKGQILRRSHAQALQRAAPEVGYSAPGDMVVAGVAFFFTQGALGRLLLALFGPQQADEDQWLSFGPVASLDPGASLSPVELSPSDLGQQPSPGASQRLYPEAPGVLPQGNPFSALGALESLLPPASEAQNTTVRFGAARSYNPSSKSLHHRGPSLPVTGHLPGAQHVLGLASQPCASQTYWVTLAPDVADVPSMDPARLRALTADLSLPTQDPSAPSQTPSALVYEVSAFEGLVDPVYEEATVLADAQLLPGGSYLQSSQLQAYVAALPVLPEASRAALDVELVRPAWLGSASVWVRVGLREQHGNLFRIAPALPGEPLWLLGEVRVCVSDAPVLFIQAQPSDQGKLAADVRQRLDGAYPIHFALTSGFQKVSEVRNYPFGRTCKTGMWACNLGHLVSADMALWADQSLHKLTSQNGRTLTLDSNTSLSAGVQVGSCQSPYDRLITTASSSQGDNVSLLPPRPAGLVARFAQDNQHLVSAFASDPDDELQRVSRSLSDNYKALSCVLPEDLNLCLGIIEDALPFTGPWHNHTQAHPSTWVCVWVMEEVGVFEEISLEDAFVDLNPSSASVLAGFEASGYPLTYTPSFLLAHAGKTLVLVCRNVFLPVVSDSLQSPCALYVPWMATSSSQQHAWEPSDLIYLDPGPYTRAGHGPRGSHLLAGCDPCSVFEASYRHAPFSKDLDLRETGLQGCGIALEFVLGLDSVEIPCQAYALFAGSTYETELEVSSQGVSVKLYALNRLTQARSMLLELPSRHLPWGSHLCIAAAIVPGEERAILQVSRKNSSTWQILSTGSTSSDTLVAACGLQQGAGSWRIGGTSLVGHAYDGDLRGVFGATSVSPPVGVTSFTVEPVSLGATEAFLSRWVG